MAHKIMISKNKEFDALAESVAEEDVFYDQKVKYEQEDQEPVMFLATKRGVKLIFYSLSFILIFTGIYVTAAFIESFSLLSIASGALFLVSIMGLIGFLLIFIDIRNYEGQQRLFLFIGMILYIISFVISIVTRFLLYLSTSSIDSIEHYMDSVEHYALLSIAGSVLSAVSLMLIVYCWLNISEKITSFMAISLYFISSVMLYYDLVHILSTYYYMVSVIISFFGVICFIIVYYGVNARSDQYYELYTEREKKPEETLYCPFCNNVIKPDWRVCHHCQKILPIRW